MPIINKNELYLFRLANFRNIENTNELGTRHLKRHRGLSTALIRAAHRADKNVDRRSNHRLHVREMATNHG